MQLKGCFSHIALMALAALLLPATRMKEFRILLANNIKPTAIVNNKEKMSSTQFDTISECVRDAKVIMKAKTQRSGLLCKYVRKALNELWRTDPENGPATGAAVNIWC